MKHEVTMTKSLENLSSGIQGRLILHNIIHPRIG